MSQIFTSGSQSTGPSASTSVLPMNIQGWFPLGLTGLISLLSKGFSTVFSNTTAWKHHFFHHSAFSIVQFSHSYVNYWQNRSLGYTDHCCQSDVSAKSVQFSRVTQSCPTLCHPMNCSTPGLPGHHQLPEFTQTQVHRVSDAIQPSHHLSSPSALAPNPSQHQSLLQWVNSSHEVAKVLEFQL